MKASEGKVGRVFVIRLEDGDELPGCIERFAKEKAVSMGLVVLVGGIGGGRMVVGPKDGEEKPPRPMFLPISGVSEIAGVGVLAPGHNGEPSLHVHAALGRSSQTMTGCLRNGVAVWTVVEAILYEITGATARRFMNEESGFELLDVEDGD